MLNLMDTPGHVDFAYEVSRRLAACEGALLIVDAAQGVEAQTVANVHLAMKQGLTIIPVINKIDLPNADLPSVRRAVGSRSWRSRPTRPSEARPRAGIGIDEILEAVLCAFPRRRSWASRRDRRVRAWFSIRLFDDLPRRESVTCGCSSGRGEKRAARSGS